MKLNFSFGPMAIISAVFAWAKLSGHITWSWWAVFSPLWVPPAIVLGLFAIFGSVVFILAMFGIGVKNKKY